MSLPIDVQQDCKIYDETTGSVHYDIEPLALAGMLDLSGNGDMTECSPSWRKVVKLVGRENRKKEPWRYYYIVIREDNRVGLERRPKHKR